MKCIDSNQSQQKTEEILLDLQDMLCEKSKTQNMLPFS